MLTIAERLSSMQDDLNSTRLKLKRAEDFEVKYDWIVKYNSNLLSENDLFTQEIQIWESGGWENQTQAEDGAECISKIHRGEVEI